ncbi:FeoB-associated Cys-rich membrane protein [Nitratiruptor sp. YY09-18]|uniref:FeoB-associated Cys-rich membrane protein n=1 Tax=Nitratiruptor sp. YY09-18 TaxID=2724901 RepID=UPI0019166505|nr:FeoB-associated Cys-rich membrane protein [Nitratiruptor sp. YY09-18]
MENLIIGLIGIASIWYIYRHYTKKDTHGHANACTSCKGCSSSNICGAKNSHH